MGKDFEQIAGQAVEEKEGRDYAEQLDRRDEIVREKHGISHKPVLEGEIKPSKPIVDPMEGSVDVVRPSKVVEINSLGSFGHRLQTTKIQRQRAKAKKAA